MRIDEDLVNEKSQRGQQRKGLLDDVIGRHNQAALHAGGVIQQAADKVSALLAVDERQGKGLQPGKGVQPDFLQHLHADDADPVHVEKGAYSPDGKYQRKQGTHRDKHGDVHVFRSYRPGNDVMYFRRNLRIVEYHGEYLGNHHGEAEAAGGGGKGSGGQCGDEQLHHRLQIPRVLEKLP